MISKSRARKAAFKIITEDDVNDPSQGITRLVHINTVQTLLVCVETPKGLDDAVSTVHSTHMARRDDMEIWHERLRHMSKSTIN